MANTYVNKGAYLTMGSYLQSGDYIVSVDSSMFFVPAGRWQRSSIYGQRSSGQPGRDLGSTQQGPPHRAVFSDHAKRREPILLSGYRSS
jgi:hypothetical protein